MRNALIIVAAAVTLVSQVSGQEPMQTPAPKKIEITFEGKTHLVVPQAAILVLVRGGGSAHG